MEIRGEEIWEDNIQMKKLKKYFIILLICTIMICLGAGIIQLKKVRIEKKRIQSIFYKTFYGDFYGGKSLILVDRSNDEVFISKKENTKQCPASLAKLFVIDYATTLTGLDTIVKVNKDTISLIKPGASVAGIVDKEYFLYDLYAAMLVPSGNDAAYVVADYCGGVLSPETETTQERIRVFMEGLNEYLKDSGYDSTVLYDPSGFDMDARTTVLDIKKVTDKLLENGWFRDMIAQYSYTATLPDGSTQIWKNTNDFLDPQSKYYNENVTGIKTGSLDDDYNLLVLYKQYGKEFLICSLGSESDEARYDDVMYIINTINESSYLSQ